MQQLSQWIAGCAALGACLYPTAVFAQGGSPGQSVPDRTIPRIMVNGQPAVTDTPPVTISGRVLVPIRFVAQSLGATVEWSSRSREVRIVRGTNNLTMTIDDTTARQNGAPRVMEAAPVIRGGRTLIPLREAGQFLNAEVSYNPSLRTVFVNTDTAGGVRGDAF